MTAAEIISLVGVAVIGIGLIITIYRNGKSQAGELGKFKGELTTELGGISKKLDDENYGLSALGEKIGDMKTNCAGVTSAFREKIKSMDKTIDEIKSTPRRRSK